MVWIGVFILKKLLIMILYITHLFATDVELAQSIYESIFSSIAPNKNLKVYTDKRIDALSLKSDYFTMVQTCKDADIIVITNSDMVQKCQHKLIFGTRYHHLDNNYVVGAFFWQKGRPNIVFSADVLSKNNIILPISFEKYIE